MVTLWVVNWAGPKARSAVMMAENLVEMKAAKVELWVALKVENWA